MSITVEPARRRPLVVYEENDELGDECLRLTVHCDTCGALVYQLGIDTRRDPPDVADEWYTRWRAHRCLQ